MTEGKNPFEQLLEDFAKEGLPILEQFKTILKEKEAEGETVEQKTGIFGEEKATTVGQLYTWDVYYKGVKFISTPNLADACERLSKLIELSE